MVHEGYIDGVCHELSRRTCAVFWGTGGFAPGVTVFKGYQSDRRYRRRLFCGRPARWKDNSTADGFRGMLAELYTVITQQELVDAVEYLTTLNAKPPAL
jgi:hypothetical protein